jgi:hypothetical protein
VHGALLCLALLGKVVIDVDNDVDNQHGAATKRNVPLPQPVRSRCGRKHWRDCLMVGCSMAGEAEFALVVAAFGDTEDLVTESIYASTVLAILALNIMPLPGAHDVGLYRRP